MVRKIFLVTAMISLLIFLTASQINDPNEISMPSSATETSHVGQTVDNTHNVYLPLVLGIDPILKTGQWDKIIKDREFTTPLFLGPGDDNTLLFNVTFRNINDHALFIGGASNVYIKNCVIHDVNGVGIKLRSTAGMSTQNVTIDNCIIYNTALSGILSSNNPAAGVDHPGLHIKNSTIYNNGTDDHNHNIYIQSSDSIIENNTVYNTTGNGISIRSSGTVRGNRIWNPTKSCIRYYSDQPPGLLNTLYIENNSCYQTTFATDSPGISLVRANETTSDWLVDNYFIRFNTVVSFIQNRPGFIVQSAEFDPKYIEFYGNLMVHTLDLNQAAHLQYLDYENNNYLTTSLAGFVNTISQPYDLHLTEDSPARNFITEETHTIPPTDIDGQPRPAMTDLDVGADQYHPTDPNN